MGRGADPAFSDEGSYNRLGEIDIPVLIANGNEDAMVPTVNSWIVSQKIKGSYLMIYPDAGHGFLFQYAEAFAKLAVDFLGWLVRSGMGERICEGVELELLAES